MADISPELLARLREAFEASYTNNRRIRALLEQLEDYRFASGAMNDYAEEVGDVLAVVFRENLSSADLPDGKMYWNIAENVVNPMLSNNYALITRASSVAVFTLNEHAGLGIRPIVPEMDRDKIRGIDDMLANAERYDDIAPRFLETVVNYSESVATDSARVNADFQYESGLSPKIIREAEAGCCEWCESLAGVYDYREVKDTGNDVYRRHENCRCRVMYEPGQGRRQNVHTKRWE